MTEAEAAFVTYYLTSWTVLNPRRFDRTRQVDMMQHPRSKGMNALSV